MRSITARLPDDASIWVHLTMSIVVGLSMIGLGFFLAWRVRSAREMIEAVSVHLHRQDADAKEILENQRKGFALLKEIASRPR